jgi:hypothetical protein
VAALHRAVALAQVDRVAVAVGQHLDLDVARVLQEFLHVDLSLPNAALASAWVLMAFSQRASVCTTRMPRPPPPPAALMITG